MKSSLKNSTFAVVKKDTAKRFLKRLNKVSFTKWVDKAEGTIRIEKVRTITPKAHEPDGPVREEKFIIRYDFMGLTDDLTHITRTNCGLSKTDQPRSTRLFSRP